jgi:hypothetical protein
MKKQSNKIQLEGAVIFAALLFFVVLLISLFSFTTKNYAGDLWKQLGISQKSGDESIKESFLQGYMYNYGARSAKNIAAGDRAAVTKDLLSYTKQFVSTDAFRKEYAKSREGARPMEPQKKTARTKEEIRKQMIDDIKKSIAEVEKNMSNYAGDLKKTMQELIDSQKEQIKEYEKPDNEIIGIMEQGEKMAVENDMKNYQQKIKEWEASYPENVNGFIKKRIQQYLDIVKTVDFTALLKESGSTKKFVNPAYERKDNDWKKVYRAGKEVNDVARQFSTEWIKGL